MELITQDINSLSKKDLLIRAREDAEGFLNSGSEDLLKQYAQIKKASEYIKEFQETVKSEALKEAAKYGKNFAHLGCEFSIRGTGDRLDYEKDPIYKEIADALSERKSLLDFAYKSKDVVYDSEGISVPKVPVKTPSVETLNISF